MRELKFRAWEYHHLLERHVMVSHDMVAANCGRYITDDETFPDRIIMQYTGLKDKNGKEIYEGDIDISGMVVTYCGDQGEGLGMVVGWYLQRDDFESWCPLLSTLGDENYEITGNIYENPELIDTL